MKLTFLGAAREVTGSRFLLQAAGKNIMVDYGMEQGVDLYENAPLPMAESRIDFVFLTHAHIDHSGYLPLLYKRGFRGAIFATDATADLCRIMLLDSAHIQESDAEWKTRKAQRQGKPPVEPLYTQEDALGACGLFRPCHYDQRVEVCPGVSIRMVDVGHLLGSASIEVTVTEGAQTRVIVFSGDIGNLHQPLLRDPQYLHAADLVVMESTYGDRSHGPVPDYLSALSRVLQETFDRGGNVVIPSFAVGRTQEMLYFIRQIKQEGRVHGHDGFPVYVDSPLGIEATTVFNDNTRECADEETLALLRAGVNPLTFPDLRITRSAGEFLLKKADAMGAEHLNIVEITGTEDSTPQRQRHQGFHDTIAGDERFTVLESISGDFLVSKGEECMRYLLDKYGEEIDVLYSHNDGMTLGAIDAIREYGLSPGSDIIIITVDGEQAAIDLLKAGEINCVVECTPNLGDSVMELAKKLAAGETVPKMSHPDEDVFTEFDDLSDLAPRGY